MRNSLVVALVIGASLAAVTAKAENAKQGWGIQFRQDTFDKTLFPIALTQQEGEKVDRSLVGFACSSSGELLSFFQAGLIPMDSATKVQFKDGETIKEVAFTSSDIPYFGKKLASDARVASELVSIFERASGADVAFRVGPKQGVFPSVGASKIVEILKQNCPSKG